MDKKALSERDICSKFLTPAILGAGWDLYSQMREEYPLTNGRIIVRGKLVSRANPKRADYVLFRKPGIPIAVIEAKDNNHSGDARATRCTLSSIPAGTTGSLNRSQSSITTAG